MFKKDFTISFCLGYEYDATEFAVTGNTEHLTKRKEKDENKTM